MQQERKRQRTEISDDGASLVTFSKTGVEDDEIRIHNTFRLWITTQADSGRLIPGYYAPATRHQEHSVLPMFVCPSPHLVSTQ